MIVLGSQNLNFCLSSIQRSVTLGGVLQRHLHISLIMHNVPSNTVRELGLESALSLKTEYPQLSQSQVDRRHIPETVSVERTIPIKPLPISLLSSSCMFRLAISARLLMLCSFFFHLVDVPSSVEDSGMIFPTLSVTFLP